MYKALKTFAGKIVMKKGDIKENIEKEIAEDLLRAGYIEEIKEDNQVVDVKNDVEEIQEVEEVKEVEKPKRNTRKKK